MVLWTLLLSVLHIPSYGKSGCFILAASCGLLSEVGEGA